MICFNCGNDANMKVLVMVNGKLEEVYICSACYKEQMNEMMEQFKDSSGDFDPEQMQKFMHKILRENKDDFEEVFGRLSNDENFDISNISFGDIEMNIDQGIVHFKGMANANKSDEDIASILNKQEQEAKKATNYEQTDFAKMKQNKEIKMLKSSVDKKKQQLSSYVESEDYMAAASLRDQIKDINKRIMFILEVEKENER